MIGSRRLPSTGGPRGPQLAASGGRRPPRCAASRRLFTLRPGAWLGALLWVASLGALPVRELCAAEPPWVAHGPLQVSADRQSLVHADGTPFLWLGCTAWALHQNLSWPDVERFLDDVQTNRFTVVQLMAANRWALKGGRNYNRHLPYLRDDPTHLNPLYWEHLGRVMNEAARRHLYVLLVYGGPGRKDERMLFVATPEAAYAYGRAVGFAFRNQPNLIWANGIDVNPDDTNRVSEMDLPGWHAMAEGVADGVNGVNRFDGIADYSTTLMTYHPRGGHSSSAWFHDAPWLDFNGAQVGLNPPAALWRTLARDAGRQPVKPVINLEPWYEDVKWKQPPVDAWEVRLQAYQSFLAGAFGHTYGHAFIWAFDSESEWGWKWRVHLAAPGRLQMRHFRAVMELVPLTNRLANLPLVVASAGEGHQSEATAWRIAATGAGDRTVALVYSPRGEWFTVDMAWFGGERVTARWWDPRTGQVGSEGAYPAAGWQRFDPPGEPGPGADWVLELRLKSGF